MDRDLLRSHGWLADQEPVIQDAVLANGREKRIEAGGTVFSAGDPPGGCYAILGGQFAVSIAPGALGPSVAHLAQPGTWYGEGAFFTRGPRRVGLQAVVDSLLFHLPLDAMDRLAANDPEWMRRFAGILMSNLDLALHAIDDLLIEDPTHRIAAVLMRCIGENEDAELVVSQAEIGRLSNASRKVVNRTLGSFATRGWIRQGYGRVQITDLSALRAHARGADIR